MLGAHLVLAVVGLADGGDQALGNDEVVQSPEGKSEHGERKEGRYQPMFLARAEWRKVQKE